MPGAGVVVAGDQAPQRFIAADGHGERRRQPHIARKLGTHQRDAPQRAISHVQRFAGIRIQQRNHLGKSVRYVWDRPYPGLGKHIACRLGNVFGRIVLAQPGRQPGAPAFSHYLAMTIGMKLVHHHSIMAGELADFSGYRVTKLLQGAGSLKSCNCFFNQRVIVWMGCIAVAC